MQNQAPIVRRRAATAFPHTLLAACLLLGSTACSLKVDLPPDFLELTGGPYRQVKALTADDARLWIREFSDPDGGSLAFWTEALRTDLVESRGYPARADGVTATTDGDGIAGTVQVFDVNRNATDMRYLVAVFVDGTTIRTAEFAAPTERFDELEASVREALGTIRG